MTTNVVAAAYIVSAVLFVLSLAGLSKHESAKEGNAFGVTGMVIALGATIWLVLSRSSHALSTLLLIAVAMAMVAGVVAVVLSPGLPPGLPVLVAALAAVLRWRR